MKKKFIAIIFVVFMIFMLFSMSDVKAASTSISESQTVKPGTTVTVTANVNAGAWDLTLSGGGQSYRIFGNTSKADNDSTSGSITFVANETTTVTLSGTIKDFFASDESKPEVVNKTTTITVKAEEQTPVTPPAQEEPTTPEPTNPPATETLTKSSVATLADLGIVPNDFKGFKPNTYSYNVEVPNEVEKIEVYAKSPKGEENKQKISGHGLKTLNVGENKFDIVVTAEDGTTKNTYTIIVTRGEGIEEEQPEETPEEDPMEEVFGLSELKIEGIELGPQFQTDVYEYKIELTEELEKLSITALATEANANVEILGNEDLKEGENIITILVKSENEEKNATYQLIVNKIIEIVGEVENVVNEVQDIIEQPDLTQDNKKRILIVSVATLVIVVIVVVAIVVKAKNNRTLIGAGEEYNAFGDLQDNEEQYDEELYNEEPEEINDYEDSYADEEDDDMFGRKKSKGKRFK